MNLIVYGKASNKTIAKIDLREKTEGLFILMHFLISNKITIASSCKGEGKCKKCIVNDDVVSCQITVDNFIQKFGSKIDINYL